MKWNELRKIALKHGFKFYKGLNGHDLYYNEEKKQMIMLERHGAQEVRKGLMEKLKKQIGF